jgi:hypothetical protein
MIDTSTSHRSHSFRLPESPDIFPASYRSEHKKDERKQKVISSTPRTPKPTYREKWKREKEIVKRTIKQQRDYSEIKDLTALYAGMKSRKEWDRQRRDQFYNYVKHKPRSHISPLDSYTFDKSKALDILGYEKNLGRGMNGKWAEAARAVGLRDGKGRTPSKFNSQQVCTKQIIV